MNILFILICSRLVYGEVEECPGASCGSRAILGSILVPRAEYPCGNPRFLRIRVAKVLKLLFLLLLIINIIHLSRNQISPVNSSTSLPPPIFSAAPSIANINNNNNTINPNPNPIPNTAPSAAPSFTVAPNLTRERSVSAAASYSSGSSSGSSSNGPSSPAPSRPLRPLPTPAANDWQQYYTDGKR